MKCPKCGYLGFEAVDRCRNCGYDFSLAPAPGGSGLELSLKNTSARAEPFEEVVFSRQPAGEHAVDTPSLAAELPLFGGSAPDDLPLIVKPSPPRTPLAVRRATPEVPRARATAPRTPTLDLAGDFEAQLAPPLPPVAPLDAPLAARKPQTVSRHVDDAGVVARLVATLIDLVILALVDIVVVYFTMQICGIGLSDIAILPRVPLLAFFLLQNGGYLVAFTAGGQTLGKMAMGIKVISSEPRSSLNFGSALMRELAWLVLAAPAGLGLATVFIGDHRGIHDRFAGTRVVRASL